MTSTATIVAGVCALIGSLAVYAPARAVDIGAPDPPAAGAVAASSVTCARLTAQQASTVLHALVTLTVDTSGGAGRSNCTYTNVRGGTVQVYVVAGADATQQYDAIRERETRPNPVSGIGDQAFESDQGFGAIQGDHFVYVVGATPRDPRGRRRLAEAMLDALR
jgi:hypothetical protein